MPPIKSVNVEELSREMKRNKTIAVQEISRSIERHWLFQGEQLVKLKEQSAKEATFPEDAEVILVCEDSDLCQQYAQKMQHNGKEVRFLAGGYLAWSQFYHPVVVGFDEQVKVWQIHRLAKGCLSYMITSSEEALIVDPSYHIDYYLGLAHREKTDIKCVVDTQIHRDHVSGGARLASKTGSPYYAPSHEHFQADNRPLEEHSHLPLGETEIEVVVLPSFNTEGEKAIGLYVNERFLLCGSQPIQDETFRQNVEGSPSLRAASDAVIVLPAHTHDLRLINEHGIVATTFGELKDSRQAASVKERAISVHEPRVNEDEIVAINLSQERIDLDKATELELGISE